MKIALLGPIFHTVPPYQHEGLERTVCVLTEGLLNRGVEVTLFGMAHTDTGARFAAICPRFEWEDTEAGPEVWETLHISEAFERAADFDLIHNWSGHLLLTFTRLVQTPILTTIQGSPSAEVLPIYQKYNGETYYVATSDADRRPELDYLATIPHQMPVDPVEEGFTRDRVVSDYLRVYEQILERERVRRIDTRHDWRPWGEYWVLQDTDRYKVKRIDVLPGKRLSYQKHFQRSEHWFIVKGTARVTLDGKDVILNAGQPVDIPAQTAHRIENIGDDIMTFIEVQHGTYFGEDDIVRLEDDFGRVPS